MHVNSITQINNLGGPIIRIWIHTEFKVAALQLHIARSVFSKNNFMMNLNPHIMYKYIKKLKVKLAFTNTTTLHMLRYSHCST